MALDHALMEIESAVLHRLTNAPQKSVVLAKVQSPSDHGRLYEHKRSFKKADFMAGNSSSIPFRVVGQNMAKSWQELLDRFEAKDWRLITVPLHLSLQLGGDDDLHIIRSIVPGMVPISFGYQENPCGMERIYSVAKGFGGVPISYHDIPKFPHPYT
ncbi:MAG: hypothetical protein Q7R79_02405 [bacterium]|nr:hypothetical protein [bacterium]